MAFNLKAAGGALISAAASMAEAKVAVAQARNQQELQRAQMMLEQRRVTLQEALDRRKLQIEEERGQREERMAGAELESRKAIQSQVADMQKALAMIDARTQEKGYESGEKVAGIQASTAERVAGIQATVTEKGYISNENIARINADIQKQGYISNETIASINAEAQSKAKEAEHGFRMKEIGEKNKGDIAIARIQAESDRLKVMASMAKKPEDVSKLRKEYIDESKRYVEVTDMLARFNALDAVENPAGIKDDALVRLYHKMLDPQSVVREGEFGQVLVVDSLTNRLLRSYTRQADGTLLGGKGSELRRDIADTIQRLSVPFLELKTQHEETYRRLAGERADEVVIPITTPGSPSRSATGMTLTPAQRSAIIARIKGLLSQSGSDAENLREQSLKDLRDAGVSDSDAAAILREAGL